MKQVQNQTTRQKMSLTQYMRSSLSLLQMGADEIGHAIEEETRRNPFLRPLPARPSGGAGGLDRTLPEVPEQQTATQDLLQQVALVRLSTAEQGLARELVYCLDERGFFTDSAQDICTYLKTTPALLTSVVRKLQAQIEPAGIFVWTLAESFAVQLQALNRFDPLIARLLDRLDLIARQDIAAICDQCDVDKEDAEDMLADIRSLTPSPLTPPAQITDHIRVPDLIIRRRENGDIRAELNPHALPDILTDDAFFNTLKSTETDARAMAYYSDCYRSAGAFVIAMQKRANTLLTIGQLIARTQEKFFQTGRPLDRRPLTMAGMASELGLNKSTISRALNNCLIDSDHGVIPASDLIVRPLSEDTGDRTREQALKRLSLLIRTESKSAPLSDHDLAQQLAKANLPISRRTVVKYRGLLGVPNATERRKAHPS
ncbi:RNA polymerase sigma-54 factor [Actibacterium sp.]|uniref:RNA polymerase factor sigma-54 n=1 Tax=Actibacterium sp. TaxID=1872125 RepID=UPI003566C6E6